MHCKPLKCRKSCGIIIDDSQGTQGPPGPAGPAGPAGAPGAPGSSPVFTTITPTWTLDEAGTPVAGATVAGTLQVQALEDAGATQTHYTVFGQLTVTATTPLTDTTVYTIELTGLPGSPAATAITVTASMAGDNDTPATVGATADAHISIVPNVALTTGTLHIKIDYLV